jgi:drug/metabolite transporter (DMT)-like permease
MSSERRMGLFWVILAASGYAFLPIFTRYIYDNSNLQPTDIAIWRFIFATPMIWFVIWLNENRGAKASYSGDSPSQIIRLMSLGILYAGAALAAFFGLQYIPASIFGIIFYTFPAFVALIAVFMGQPLALAAWLALGLTLVGVMLTVPDLSIGGQNTLLGVMIAILNALFVAIYFTLVSKLMKKTSSVMRGSAYVITGTLVVLLLAIPFFGFRVPGNPTTWLHVLGLATVSTAMPITVINLGIHKIGAAQASIISTFEPVLTMLLALFLLGESILPIQWIGAAFIIGGVIFLETRSQSKVLA